MKTLQQKKYMHYNFSHFLTSKFIYKSSRNLPHLKWMNFFIKHKQKRIRKFHFLYLFLLTKIKPYINDFHFSAKMKSFVRKWHVSSQKKNNSLTVYMHNRKKFIFIRQLLFNFIPTQQINEYPIYSLNKQVLSLSLANAPYTYNTSVLLLRKFFTTTFSLQIQLVFVSCSVFQKFFLLNSYKLLKTAYIPGLEKEYL